MALKRRLELYESKLSTPCDMGKIGWKRSSTWALTQLRDDFLRLNFSGVKKLWKFSDRSDFHRVNHNSFETCLISTAVQRVLEKENSK
jgi:hypothetical protein